MSKPQEKYPIIPEKVFWLLANKNIAYKGFILHQDGRCSFVLPEVVVETRQTSTTLGKLTQFKLIPQVKHNICAVPVVPADATRLYMPSIEQMNHRWRPSVDDPDPIKIGAGGLENATHLVKSGETIVDISRKYGVKIEDLLKINNQRKPEIGKYYNVFPEIQFSNNPYGGYQNANSNNGTVFYSSDLAEIVSDFIFGGDGENIIVTGGAREQIKNWDVVVDLVEDGIRELKKSNFSPGEVYETHKSIPGIVPYTWNSIVEHIKQDFGFQNNAKDYFSPVHYIGSFRFSMRMNADGRTATATVYDSKSAKSMFDNKLGDWVNKEDGGALTTTYQRYIWTVTIFSK